MITLKINDVIIPFHAADDLAQSHTQEKGGRFRRMMSGRGTLQTHWSKYDIQLSGSGTVPAALSSIDFNGPVLLHWVAPLSLSTQTTTATIPMPFRLDFAPWCLAFNGLEKNETPVNMVGQTANITPVPNAQYYVVNYLPIMTVILPVGAEQNNAVYQAEHGWSLNLKEV